MSKFVIIGGGIAGMTAAETIKKLDSQNKVTVISKEQFLPYNRYILTDYLCDIIDETELFFANIDFFNRFDIKYRKGEYVKTIHPEQKTIVLNHNEVMEYDKLLIATGSLQYIGPLLRPYSQFIKTYYTLEDILLLKQKLNAIETCVVYGQSPSVLDLLSGLNNLGKKVTYIVKGHRAEFPLLKTENSEYIHEFLSDKGIEIITNDRIIRVDKHKKHYEIETEKNKSLITDILFGWDERRPNISFIPENTLNIKSGILVDSYMCTSSPDIFAAGDCVEIYHPELKNYWINFGWPNAKEQGEIAGKNMAGEKAAYKIHEILAFNILGKPFEARWWE